MKSKAIVVSIAVHSAHRRKGMASQLLRDSFQEARRSRQDLEFFELQVREDNVGAIALYERLGFRRHRYLQDYYGRGKHGILMQLR
jgi:[ribosomal protein S18]-alanine N-acetyltransferase